MPVILVLGRPRQEDLRTHRPAQIYQNWWAPDLERHPVSKTEQFRKTTHINILPSHVHAHSYTHVDVDAHTCIHTQKFLWNFYFHGVVEEGREYRKPLWLECVLQSSWSKSAFGYQRFFDRSSRKPEGTIIRRSDQLFRTRLVLWTVSYKMKPRHVLSFFCTCLFTFPLLEVGEARSILSRCRRHAFCTLQPPEFWISVKYSASNILL